MGGIVMRDFFRFALDALFSNRRRVLLTVAIIAVGVASLVGIETAVDVLTRQVVGSFDKLGAGLFTIRSKPDAPPLTARQAMAFCASYSEASLRSDIPLLSQKNARSTEYHPLSFASAWTLLQDPVVVQGGGKATDPVVHLLAADDGYLACQGVALAAGRNFSPYEVERHAAVALLGDNVRRRLFGEHDALGEMVSVGGLRLRVVGVVARQGAVFGTGLDDALICPLEPTATACSVTVRSAPGQARTAMLGAGSQMAVIRRLPPGAEPDFEMIEADSAEATLASLRAKLSLVALAIGLVTMLGAAVGLMNSMLVSVKERTREIGTRRALGARARDIRLQFLGEALLIGLAGSASGVLLGLLLGNLVALALEGGFSLPWGWTVAAVLLAAFVSLASGILPARRAAALDPIVALHSL